MWCHNELLVWRVGVISFNPTCDMTYSYGTWLLHMGHDSFICDITDSHGTWLNHVVSWWRVGVISFNPTCDMTHSYGTWLIHMGHDLFIRDMTDSYGTWLIHVGHDSLIQSYVWHDSLVRVTSFIMMHCQVSQYSFVSVTPLIRQCDMIHL